MAFVTTDDRLAAVFFIPRRGEGRKVGELLEAAGAANLDFPTPDDPTQLVGCFWASEPADGYLDDLADHQVLQIYFSELGAIKLVLEGRDDELAFAFRDACEALRPDLAFITSSNFQAEASYFLPLEQFVVEWDPNPIDFKGMALLYLSEEMAVCWTLPLLQDWERERLAVSSGVLVFREKGDQRWWSPRRATPA